MLDSFHIIIKVSNLTKAKFGIKNGTDFNKKKEIGVIGINRPTQNIKNKYPNDNIIKYGRLLHSGRYVFL